MIGTRCPTERELEAFQLGDLPEALLDQVGDHLETCADCERLAQKLDRTADAILMFIRDGSTLLPGPGDTRELTPVGVQPPPVVKEEKFPFLRPPAQPDEMGRLGPYRVLGLLGAGGMAYVFHGEDLALRRAVAIKVMKPELQRDPEGWLRFLREARVLASIKHEHLVTVYQVGQEEGAVYLAMELLRGESLESRLSRPDRPAPAEILRLAKALASGLAVVHGHGIIHRDIKPANIWLESPGQRVKILDFGLARVAHDDAALTQVGTVMGTPSYMAPEQARGDPVDARSDLFSLGCVLYRAAAGARPFRDDNTMAALTALAVDHPTPVDELNPQLPAVLADLIMQLLAKQPAERPASAQAVLQRLEEIEAGKAGPAPAVKKAPAELHRGKLLVSLGAGVAIAALLGGLLLGHWLTAEPRPAPAGPTAAASGLADLGVDWPRANQPGIYLTDLKPAEQVKWLTFPPPPPKKKGPKPPDEEQEEDFQPAGPDPWPSEVIPVRVKGVEAPHGIFMHGVPPHLGGGAASISYALDKKYQTFFALVTLNDGPPRSEAPILFTVYADGKQVWQSREISSQDDIQRVEVPVQGAAVLKIEIQCPDGHVKGAHAVWVEPFLAK